MTTRRDLGLPSHPSRPFLYGNPSTPESLAGVWRGPRPLTTADLSDVLIDTIVVTEGSAPTRVNISFRVYERQGHGGVLFVWTNPGAFTSPDPSGDPDGSLEVLGADTPPLEGFVDANTQFVLPEGSPNQTNLLREVMVGATREKRVYAEYQTDDGRTSGRVAIPLGQPLESFDNTGRINPGVPLSDGEYVETIKKSVERLHTAIGLTAQGFVWENDVKNLIAGVPGAMSSALPVIDADAINTLIDTEFKVIKNVKDVANRPIGNFLGKALAADPDSLDGVPNGLTYRKLTGVDATGKATNAAFVDNLFASEAVVDRLFANGVFTQAVMTKVLGADSIIADKIAAAELAAITANLGVITAGRLRSIDQRFDLHLDYKIFTIVDPLGQTRVQIGNYNQDGTPTGAGGGDSWGIRLIGKDGQVMLDTDSGTTGVIYGRYINVDNLAAIKADLGTVTAGRMLSGDGLWGIILSGTVPGGLRGFVNFSDSNHPFLKHPRLNLPDDTSGITKRVRYGASQFCGINDSTQYKITNTFLSQYSAAVATTMVATIPLPRNASVTNVTIKYKRQNFADSLSVNVKRFYDVDNTNGDMISFTPSYGGIYTTTVQATAGNTALGDDIVYVVVSMDANTTETDVGIYYVELEYVVPTYDDSL